MSDIDDIIEGGIVFRGAPKNKDNEDKVKTKAKKKKYITGAHGSGSAAISIKTQQTLHNGHKTVFVFLHCEGFVIYILKASAQHYASKNSSRVNP